MAVGDSFFQSELFKRISIALLLLIIGGVCLYQGPPYSTLLGSFFTIILAFEWYQMVKKNKYPFFKKVIISFVGSIYLSIAMVWLMIKFSQQESWPLLLGFIGIVTFTDTAAYFGGKYWGGAKLAPKISPNKTWSGFFSGMIGGALIGLILSKSLLETMFPLWMYFIFPLVAQGGDLLESFLKRISHVKDSGTILPGHGGVFDRFDSLIALSFMMGVYQFLN